MVVTAATPFVVYVAVRYGVPAVIDGLLRWFATRTDVEPPRPMDVASFRPLGLLMAGAATVVVARMMWGGRSSTEAWGKGARGEVATGQLLARLPDGFAVRHDLRMPGSSANIDHVVVGPTGVFTVETKNYRDGVRIVRGRVTAGGRRRDGLTEQAQRQAQVIRERTSKPVRAIVVVHGGVRLGWFSSAVVAGVRFCGPRRLVRALTKGDRSLAPGEVAAVLACLDPSDQLPVSSSTPMALEQCSCGGDWVERTRRADGARFLGCSRFPTCRRTWSLDQGSSET